MFLREAAWIISHRLGKVQTDEKRQRPESCKWRHNLRSGFFDCAMVLEPTQLELHLRSMNSAVTTSRGEQLKDRTEPRC